MIAAAGVIRKGGSGTTYYNINLIVLSFDLSPYYVTEFECPFPTTAIHYIVPNYIKECH